MVLITSLIIGFVIKEYRKFTKSEESDNISVVNRFVISFLALAACLFLLTVDFFAGWFMFSTITIN